MRGLLPVVALILSGCGGSPTRPSPIPNPNAQTQTWSLSGTVRATLTGAPVAGASLAFSNLATVTTNSAGEWRLERAVPVTSRMFVEITAPGFVGPRRVYVEGGEASRTLAPIEMTRDTAPFSLGFYRKFARNDYDDPGNYQWLKQWTVNPSVYLDTRNPKGGTLSSEEIEVVRESAAYAVPAMTGGKRQLDRFEYGAAERPMTSGWINVSVIYEPANEFCGRAQVAANPGWILLNYDRCASECGSLKISPRTTRHEFGHAMGFWHHDGGGIMDSVVNRGACNTAAFSDAELFHARIAYSRPVGNADVDWDQPTSALLRSPASGAPVVQCFRR